jgi:hypothetical protein
MRRGFNVHIFCVMSIFLDDKYYQINFKKDIANYLLVIHSI